MHSPLIRAVFGAVALVAVSGCASVGRTASVDMTAETAAEVVERLYIEGFLEPEIDYDDPVLRNRQLFLIGDLDEAAAQRLNRSLAYLDAIEPGEPITLHVHTSGGSSGFVVAHFIQTLTSPVHVVALDFAMSAGAVVLASGTGTRSAFPSSSIMVHIIDAPQNFRADATYNEEEQIRNVEREFWTRYTDLPTEIFSVEVETEFYLTPEQALAFGIIDEIVSER